MLDGLMNLVVQISDRIVQRYRYHLVKLVAGSLLADHLELDIVVLRPFECLLYKEGMRSEQVGTV